MKLSLQKFLNSRVILLTSLLLFVVAFSTDAQMVTCPAETNLGTFDCNTINDVPPQVNSLADAMEAYGIEITGALPETGVTTIDSELVFYCLDNAREVTREVIIYNDENFDFQYTPGEEITICTFTIMTEPDEVAPVFEAPVDATTTCIDGIDPEETGRALVSSDSCPDLNPDNVNFSDAPPTIGSCPGEKIYVRSWTATDPCGNANDPQTQVITVLDVTGPEFTVPDDVTIDCAADPADAPGEVTDGFDECEEAEIMIQGRIVSDMTQENTPCPGSITYIKRWGGIDGCGNANTKDQIIVAMDTTPPDFEVPADATIACGDDLPAGADIDAVDDCDPNGLVAVFMGSVVTPDGAADCEARTMVRTWTAVDGCGNETTKTQTLMLEACVPTCNDDPCVGDITTLSADGCNCEVVTPQVIGCTDSAASNFDPTANCPCDDCCLLNFDLALQKVLSTPEPIVIGTGATVTFTITVINQGDVTAQNIEITDYIPEGLILSDGNWTQSGNAAVTTIAGPLAAGESASVDITFEFDPSIAPGSYTNFAEISAAEDENGNPGMDSDSTADNDPDNDGTVVDNEIMGGGITAGEDEDDHDGATFTLVCAAPTCNTDPCVGDITVVNSSGCECELVEPQVKGCTDPDALNFNPNANCDEGCIAKVFDLALDKSVITAGPYSIGQDVTYAITVSNEGNIPAQNISVEDVAPPALTFNAAASSGWIAVSGSISTTTIAGPLAPGTSASVNITYTINNNAIENADITNSAEITGAEDEDGNMVPDVDSTPGNGSNNEDDDDTETIQITCPDDAGQMGTALKSVCGGETVNAPADGVVVGEGSVHVYLLHDGAGTIIYDFSTNGTFVNDGVYPTNSQLYISSIVGPPGPDGIPDLSATCTDVVLPGCPVIFYDPISINHYVDCNQTTGNATVNFSITGGGPSASGGTYTVTGSYNGTVNPGQQYIIDGISAGSTYTITVVNDGKGCTGSINEGPINCTKTPIELISFDGEAQQNGNLLKWVTASEIENDFYTLERASADMNFVEINQQQGAGTYSTTSKYSYLDREAPNGLSYYQLKQTDFDGTTVIVGVIEIQRSEPTFDIINIHPIPVLDNFELYIESEENQAIEIQVINSIGELMIVKSIEVTNAVNKIEVDVSTLAGGIYVISAIAGENTVSQKIIKY